MKKRVLIISLCLALLLTALAPATALAKDYRCYRPAGPTSFTGSGLIYVTDMPAPIQYGPYLMYQGEIVEGYLDQCDWDLLAGTAFWSSHDSVVRVDGSGNVRGMMAGTFKIMRPDGTLEGIFYGRITGTNFFDPAVAIVDQGTWVATRCTGAFMGVKAWGTWSAALNLGDVGGQITLVGPLSWGGQYSGKLPHKPCKPGIKPWKPIQPCKPVIKPWRPISPWKLMFPWSWKKK